LPAILAIKNSSINLSLEFTYRSYFAIYAPGIVAVALAAFMTKFPRIGRRITMIVSSALMGVSIILFSLANGQASNIGLDTMEYFFQTMFNAVLYGWTPEVFPTSIRGTASGLASFWGRLFSIITPIIANSILPEDGLKNEAGVKKILYFAGGITMGCVVTIALIPHKALGQRKSNR
jgi:MFS family permease